jgi:serine protease AprX
VRFVAFVGFVCLAVLALPGASVASRLYQRLDPRLSASLAPGAEAVPVWVDFVDKGEQGPSDLERRLEQAERELTPESRARRIRAGVRPLVDYLDLPLSAEYVAALRSRGLEPYGLSRWMNGCCVRTSGAELAALAELDCVRKLSPTQVARPRQPLPEPLALEPSPSLTRPIGAASAAGTPAFYGQSYTQMLRLGVPAVHDSGFVGTGVTIAVFDEGFNYFTKHEATRNIDVGDRTRDFVRGGPLVQDTLGSIWSHGQHTLSCVGGNAPGVYVGPGYGARFALARTEDNSSEKPIEMVNWLMAAEWADSLGADIISSSLGYFSFPDSAAGAYNLTAAMLDGHTSLITRAAEIAAAKGIIVVNSAGNSGPGVGTLDAPADASGDSILAVGAVDSSGIIAGFSSRGPTADGRIKPDVCAQGRAVLLALASGTTNAYARSSGTSFSCPLVAGLVACLLQARPGWTPVQVIHALKLSSSRASLPDVNFGWGVVNGLAALRWTPGNEPPMEGLPWRFMLRTSNPMDPSRSPAEMIFMLPKGLDQSDCRVAIYDIGGREVRTLFSGTLLAYQPAAASWDGTDRDGRAQKPGLYFASLEAGGHRSVIRLTLLR